MSTEGRFDEASQRDVLALAARLQKMHLETMSASEIEAAAVEGGMDAAFVREAIRRVSTSTVSKSIGAEEEKETSSPGEWTVGILVPLLVGGILFLRNLESHGNLDTVKAIVIVAGIRCPGRSFVSFSDRRPSAYGAVHANNCEILGQTPSESARET